MTQVAALPSEQDSRRAVFAAASGTALEWFDFTLFGAVSATIMPQLFFPQMNQTGAILASLATFGVGLAVRPLGAVVCGWLGDRYGRRTLLLATVTAMGLSSMLIGVLPTYAQIGIWAQIFLVLLRVVQGFALGGESTGAQLLAVEYANPDRRGRYSGYLGVCSPISQICANGVLLLLSSTLSEADFLSWGWRIPFIMSFLLVLMGLYIRLKVEETPAFVTLKQEAAVNHGAASPSEKIRWKSVLRWMLFFCGPAALFYLITVFSLGYVTHQLGFGKQTAFAILMFANLCAVFGALIGGSLSDRIGRKRALAIGSVGTLIMIAIYFPLLQTHSLPVIAIAAGLFLGLTQFQSGIQPVAFAEAFPTATRYTSSALAYSGANLIAAAPMPSLAVWLLQIFDGKPYGVIILCGAWNLISLAMIVTARETRGIDLDRA